MHTPTLHTTLRAAARLTPRMAVHQMKRLVRNRVVPKIPEWYARMVDRTARRLPSPSSLDRVPQELASFIGSFYHHSESDIRDAGDGRFTLLGRTVDFGSPAAIDWTYRLPEENDHHLWRMKLCQLEILHSLLAGSDPAGHQTALALLKSFTHARSFAAPDAFSVQWSPYGASHRLLAVLSGLSIGVATGGVDAGTRSEIEQFARLDAAFLWHNIEHDLRNNHTERNLAALCLYHLAAGSISRSRARRLDRDVRRIIDATVLADGTQIERSAMYQGLTLMSLEIFAACPFLSAATRTSAKERSGSAAAAWLFLTHHDGEIALFNDSWVDEVPAPASVLNAGRVRLPESLPEAGYYRIGSGSVDALMDSGEIGPRWNPGHGHADFLAIEVDVAGRRFVVDPGTSQYSTGPQRIYERSAASHNGPRYRDVEPVEYSGCFKVGKLNHAAPIPAAVLAQLPTPSIGGTISTPAGPCTRIVSALEGGGLLIVDRWGSGKTSGATTLLIPRGWRLEIDDVTSVRARLEDTVTSITVYGGAIDSIAEKTWSRRYMRPEPAAAVTLAPRRRPGGDQILAIGIGVGRDEEAAAARAAIEAVSLW